MVILDVMVEYLLLLMSDQLSENEDKNDHYKCIIYYKLFHKYIILFVINIYTFVHKFGVLLKCFHAHQGCIYLIKYIIKQFYCEIYLQFKLTIFYFSMQVASVIAMLIFSSS